jgi:protein O-mannosyl-transferase
LFFAIIWLLSDISLVGPVARGMMRGTALAALIVFSVLTEIQVGYWRNSETLFNHANTVTDDNWVAEYHLATICMQRHDYRAAIEHFLQVQRINPTLPDTYNDIGNCFYVYNPDSAIDWYERAIELAPASAEGHINLGRARLRTGDFDGASVEFRKAIALDPASSDAKRGLAAALAHKQPESIGP